VEIYPCSSSALRILAAIQSGLRAGSLRLLGDRREMRCRFRRRQMPRARLRASGPLAQLASSFSPIDRQKVLRSRACGEWNWAGGRTAVAVAVYGHAGCGIGRRVARDPARAECIQGNTGVMPAGAFMVIWKLSVCAEESSV